MSGIPGVSEAISSSDRVWDTVSGSEYFGGSHQGSPEGDSVLMGQDISPHRATEKRTRKEQKQVRLQQGITFSFL